MSIVKIIEVISEGKSMEEAMKLAIEEASKTVKNIRQIDVKHIQGIVNDNKISIFRINANISFLIEKH